MPGCSVTRVMIAGPQSLPDTSKTCWITLLKLSNRVCGRTLHVSLKEKVLEEGADLYAPKALLKRFQHEGRYAEYGLLSAICVGDLWPAARKHEQGTITSPTCPRCGQAPETLTHRHWQCEANNLIFEPEVVNTQSCVRAVAGAEDSPMFRNRGIVPTDWTGCAVCPCAGNQAICQPRGALRFGGSIETG